MNLYSFVHDVWFTFYYCFSWRDALEIIFFSTIIYSFSLWLKHDRHKNLLGYFYAYCTVGLCAYAANLSLITTFLCLFSPLIIMLFMLMHQQTLQKNFIALRNNTPISTGNNNDDWLDMLIRSCLVAINNNKSIVCVIEHKDSISEFLHASVALQAQLKDDLLAIIIQSQSFNQEQIVWVNSQGHLRGFNAYWKQLSGQLLHTDVVHNHTLEAWKQDALFFSTNLDTVHFHINPTTRTFDVVIQGKAFDAIPASKALPFIKKYLNAPYNQSLQGELSHATQTKKYSVHQHNP